MDEKMTFVPVGKRNLTNPGFSYSTAPPDSRINGGIHLFASRELAEAYLGRLRARMAARPDVTGFTATIYDVKVNASRLTHGPVDVPASTDSARPDSARTDSAGPGAAPAPAGRAVPAGAGERDG